MNLLRALATVSGMTFASRVLGYVRDFLIARAFGAGLAVVRARATPQRIIEKINEDRYSFEPDAAVPDTVFDDVTNG